jgi:E3 ubiquitin-protein ligase RNF146
MAASDDPICPVCLGTPRNSITTPCNHVYCYLCLKSVLHTTQGHGSFECPYCRQPLTGSVLQNPDAETYEDDMGGAADSKAPRDLWLYRAKSNGWWLFDDDTMDYIEDKYKSYEAGHGMPNFELRVCGILFDINLERLEQRNIQTDVVRKITRVEEGTDLDQINIRGRAGVSYKKQD